MLIYFFLLIPILRLFMNNFFPIGLFFVLSYSNFFFFLIYCFFGRNHFMLGIFSLLFLSFYLASFRSFSLIRRKFYAFLFHRIFFPMRIPFLFFPHSVFRCTYFWIGEKFERKWKGGKIEKMRELERKSGRKELLPSLFNFFFVIWFTLSSSWSWENWKRKEIARKEKAWEGEKGMLPLFFALCVRKNKKEIDGKKWKGRKNEKGKERIYSRWWIEF